MELNPNHIVCACRNVTVLDVLDYIENNNVPRTDETIDKLMNDCNIGQSCKKCVSDIPYNRIDIDLLTLIDNL